MKIAKKQQPTSMLANNLNGYCLLCSKNTGSAQSVVVFTNKTQLIWKASGIKEIFNDNKIAFGRVNKKQRDNLGNN